MLQVPEEKESVCLGRFRNFCAPVSRTGHRSWAFLDLHLSLAPLCAAHTRTARHLLLASQAFTGFAGLMPLKLRKRYKHVRPHVLLKSDLTFSPRVLPCHGCRPPGRAARSFQARLAVLCCASLQAAGILPKDAEILLGSDFPEDASEAMWFEAVTKNSKRRVDEVAEILIRLARSCSQAYAIRQLMRVRDAMAKALQPFVALRVLALGMQNLRRVACCCCVEWTSSTRRVKDTDTLAAV